MEKKATRNAYGEALVELAKENDKIVVLDADLAKATMTVTFQKEYPDRHYNMGIAEANMIDVAAGMTNSGLIPFCSTFAMFGAGRVYEQIRNTVAYAKLNVKLAMTHAGISVGEDGGSHQMIEDIALMRAIPGMTVIVPADANETKEAVFAAAKMEGPVYIRLARCASPVFEGDLIKPFEIGKANVLKDGSDVAIFTYGFEVAEALKAAEILENEGKSTAVINVHTIKPLDTQCVLNYAKKCKTVVCAEEATVIGGLGEAIGTELLKAGVACKYIQVGVEDKFGQSGSPDELMKEYGLTGEQIAEKVLGK